MNNNMSKESLNILKQLRQSNEECYKEYKLLQQTILEHGKYLEENTKYELSVEEESIVITDGYDDMYYFIYGKFFFDDLELLKEANQLLNNELKRLKEGVVDE